MRLVATLLLWLVTTVALAVAVPAGWTQRNVIEVDGYAALAESVARDPQVQDCMAAELTTQVVALTGDRGSSVNRSLIRGAARNRLHRQLGVPGPIRAGQPAGAPVYLHRYDPLAHGLAEPLGS